MQELLEDIDDHEKRDLLAKAYGEGRMHRARRRVNEQFSDESIHEAALQLNQTVKFWPRALTDAEVESEMRGEPPQLGVGDIPHFRRDEPNVISAAFAEGINCECGGCKHLNTLLPVRTRKETDMSHGRPMPGKPLVFPSDAERDPTPLFRPIPEINCMTSEVWTGMSLAAQAAYRNRNEWLWEFVRAVDVDATADLRNCLQPALAKAKELERLHAKPTPCPGCDRVPKPGDRFCAACGEPCGAEG